MSAAAFSSTKDAPACHLGLLVSFKQKAAYHNKIGKSFLWTERCAREITSVYKSSYMERRWRRGRWDGSYVVRIWLHEPQRSAEDGQDANRCRGCRSSSARMRSKDPRIAGLRCEARGS